MIEADDRPTDPMIGVHFFFLRGPLGLLGTFGDKTENTVFRHLPRSLHSPSRSHSFKVSLNNRTRNMRTLLAATLGLAGAAKLNLSGSESGIVFGGENQATISASCAAAKPFATAVATGVHRAPDVKDGNAVADLVHLGGIPTTCSQRSLKQPCVPHRDDLPALFFCKYEGSAGSVTKGPVKASRDLDKLRDIDQVLLLWPAAYPRFHFTVVSMRTFSLLPDFLIEPMACRSPIHLLDIHNQLVCPGACFS